MKLTKRSSLAQVALSVGGTLRRHGIRAVLTGGACAAIHSKGAYLSKDVDFIVAGRVGQNALDEAMAELGFERAGSRYTHPLSLFYVEFPPGPLAVGGDFAIQPIELRAPKGRALALSATDACRDRLAAFYHWRDRQSLKTAVQIASHGKADLARVRKWSETEGHADDFREFLAELDKVGAARPPRKATRRKSSG